MLALAQSCAPAVAPGTLLSVSKVESGFETLAIGVNGPKARRVKPADLASAVRVATDLIAQGENIDLGLGQINSKNLKWLGLSITDTFDPCKNLAASATVLKAGYAPATLDARDAQAALRTALSRYNTGHPTRGVTNGYVAKVAVAATQVVPQIAIAQEGPPSDLVASAAVRMVAEAPPPPAWDVFARSAQRSSSFVFTPQPRGETP